MPCDPSTAQMLARVLWPSPIALGVWAFGTSMVKQQARQVADFLGFGIGSGNPNSAHAQSSPGATPALPSSPVPEFQKALERLRQGTTRRPEEANNPGSMASSAGAAPSAAREDKPAAGQSGRTENGPGLAGKEGSRNPSPANAVVSSQPWKRLVEAYGKKRTPMRPDPTTGSVLVSGMVELRTGRVSVVVDLWGWYDPKIKAHSPGTVHLFVRKIEPLVKRPLEG